MANTQTTISLSELLWKEAKAIASELQISSDDLMALALAEFIRCYQNKQLLDRINAAYNDDVEDEVLRACFRHHHRQIAEREW